MHPAAWWVIALAAILCVTISHSTAVIALVFCASLLGLILTELLGQNNRIARAYIPIALVVIAIRVGLRLLFGTWPIVSIELIAAISEGARLGSILLIAAFASAIANPRKLLASTPNALVDLATATTVAINMVPQLASSIVRVRRAARLRGEARGLAAFKTIAIPVIEDALDASLALAASMDARGFGFRPVSAKRLLRLQRVLIFLSLLAMLTGILELIAVGNQTAGYLILVLAPMLLVGAIRTARSNGIRTRLTRSRFTLIDCLAIVLALVAFTAMSASSFSSSWIPGVFK